MPKQILNFFLALPDQDYVDVVMNVTLSQITPRGCILVPIIPDNIPEDSEFFFVSIVRTGVSEKIGVDIHVNNVTAFIKGTCCHRNVSIQLGFNVFP